MIGFWRRRSKTFVVHLVFWPIIAVFVIWGFERYGNPIGGAAAVVNDRTITMADYRNSLQRMTDFYSQMMQGKFDESMLKQFHIRETALQQLINNELIAEQAEKMGLEVTDEEVRQKIMEFPVLQKDGHFSRENYESLLRYYRQTPAQFESELKKGALLDKTRALFESNVLPSTEGLKRESELHSNKINLEFLQVDRDSLVSKLDIEPKQIDDYLKDENHLKAVKEYYELHKREYSHEAEVKARHILVKAAKGNKTEEEAGQAKIAKIKSELKAGASFASLAEKYSDDPGSKAKGGELGWFGKGRMVPDFEQAALGAKSGELVGPVQSDFGFHLILVEDKKNAEVVTFDEAKKQIAKKILGENQTDRVIAALEKKMKENPAAAAKELEKMDSTHKWRETGFFTLADEVVPMIGESDDLLTSAFALTAEKSLSPKLFQIAGKIFAIRLKRRESAPEPSGALTAIDKDKGGKSGKAEDNGKAAFYAWAGKLYESAKIKTNPRLMSDEGDPGE